MHLKGDINNIHDIDFDNKGNPWIASQNICIAKYENLIWEQFFFDTLGKPRENPLNIVQAIELDQDGNVWVGSFDGLYKIDNNMNIISKIYKYPLKRNWAMTILSMLHDKQNNVWFSAENEALYKTTGEEYTRFDYDSITVLNGKTLNNLVLDSNNNIWFYANAYLMKPVFGFFDGSEFIIIDNAVTGLDSYLLMPLGVDRFNNVWFRELKMNEEINKIYLSGLVKYNGQTWVLYDTTTTTLPTNEFYCIAFDSFDNIWLGTDKGLIVMNEGEEGVILDVESSSQLSESGLSISPNPAGDYVEINIPPLERGSGGVSVFDVLGIKYMDQLRWSADTRLRGNDIFVFDEKNVKINVSQLSPGVYFVRIGSYFAKFVKM